MPRYLASTNYEQCELIGEHLLRTVYKDFLEAEKKRGKEKSILEFRKKREHSRFYDFGGVKGDRENPSAKKFSEDGIANYYGAIINIDHHFWRLGPDKELILDYGTVGQEKLKGSTYLHVKSTEMMSNNCEFFLAKNLAKLSWKDFKEWLADDTGKVPFHEPKQRLELTREFGRILQEKYDGRFLKVYQMSAENHEHLLLNSGNGFLERCEAFSGYSDPGFFKKANLMAKIMERRNLLRFKDTGNKTPPLDYHLQNVAIKTGMISISGDLLGKIRNREFLDEQNEWELRQACKEAYSIVAEISNIDPYYIDDIFWSEGRKCQLKDCREQTLSDVCLANKEKPSLKELPMPLVDTWRY